MDRTSAPSGEDRAAIEAILAGQARAWAAGDAAAFVADAADDVVFTNIFGMFSIGKAPMEAQHARIFATIYQGSVLRQEIAHIAMPTPDVAIVDTVAAVSGAEAPPGIALIDGAVRTRLEQVMVRREGTWRVASFHNVAISAALSAPPAPEA